MAQEPKKEQGYVVTRQMWLSEWPVLLVLLLDLLFAVLIVPRLPQQVPVHWTAMGTADQYANPWVGAFLIPLVNLAAYVFLLYAPMFNPQFAAYAKPPGQYRWMRWLTAFGVALFHLILMLWL